VTTGYDTKNEIILDFHRARLEREGLLKKRCETQPQMEFVSIEQLLPRDHLLSNIHKTISFDFIREKVEGLYYPDNGRQAIDPVILFKMLFYPLPLG